MPTESVGARPLDAKAVKGPATAPEVGAGLAKAARPASFFSAGVNTLSSAAFVLSLNGVTM